MKRRLSCLNLQVLEQRTLLTGVPIITEFLAVNSGGLADQDGDHSDWIEIYNPTDGPIELAGWHLTDNDKNFTKWAFAEHTLGAGEFLVVFASGKDRSEPGQELHTNFSLSSSGEYLALVEPNGETVAWEIAPEFPPQFSNVSYGVPFILTGDDGAAEEIILEASFESWVRQSNPSRTLGEWDNDLVSVWSSAGGDLRWGVVEFDLSGLAGTTVETVGLELWSGLNGFSDDHFPIKQFAAIVSPSVATPELDWTTITALTQTPLVSLGEYDLPAASATPAIQGVYLLSEGSTADIALIQLIVDVGGTLTLVMMADEDGTNYRNSWGDGVLRGEKPRLVINSQGAAYDYELSGGDPLYFTTPTPGNPNVGGTQAIVTEPSFSVERGFYDAPFEVTISGATPGTTLIYTLDGSTPSPTNGAQVAPANAETPPSTTLNVASTTVVRATEIKDGHLSRNVSTHTYFFVDDILTQSADGSAPTGWPTSSINSQRFHYGMDPRIVFAGAPTADFNGDGTVNEADFEILMNHWLQSVPAGTLGDMNYDGLVNLEDFHAFKAVFESQLETTTDPTVRDALLALPSLSIVVDMEHLIDPQTGIYVNAGQRGREWERPISLELVHPDGSTHSQVEAGLRIRGGFSRSGANPKHSFRLFFRGEYGDSTWDFPLFGEGAVDSFDKLDLRTAQNDAWAWQNSEHMTMAHDIFSRHTQRDMGQPYTRSEYYHLYINGMYFGIFQSQERAEAAFGSSTLGGNERDYDAIKSAGGSGGYATEATDGNLDAWFDLWSQARAGVADNADYYRLQGLNADGSRNTDYPVLLDAENLIDYMLVIFYTGDEDAPLSLPLQNNRSNNWYAVRDRTGDEGFKFFIHDAEQWPFTKHNRGGLHTDRTGPFTGSNQNNFLYSNPQWLHQDLMANADYRLLFADHVQKHFFNDGALTTESSIERFLSNTSELEVAILAESARWGASSSGRADNPFTKDHWQAAVDRMVNEFFPYRPAIVLSQLAVQGLTSPIGVPVMAINGIPKHGGVVDSGDLLTLSGPGQIYYTLDGTDPRLPGGAISPSALLYDGAITINLGTQVNARSLDGSTWSALADATFDASHAEDFSFEFVGQTYHQNFDSFAGTELTLPPHITIQAGGSSIYRDVFDTNTNSASDFTGIMAATSDGANHSLAWRDSTGPANLDDARILFTFTNNTGVPITGFDVSYDVEVWVNGRRDNQLRFKYDIYPDSSVSQPAAGRNAFETDIFATINPNHTPIADNGDQFLLDGKNAANRETVSGYVDLFTLLVDDTNPSAGVFGELLPGQTAYFRWQISNANLTAGNRSALAIDNVSITARAEASVESADFTDDGIVDGFDFLAWQRGFGTTNVTHSDGDANGDGVVDGSDLAVWEAQFGNAPMVLTASNAEESTTTGNFWLSLDRDPSEVEDEFADISQAPATETLDDAFAELAPSLVDSEDLSEFWYEEFSMENSDFEESLAFDESVFGSLH